MLTEIRFTIFLSLLFFASSFSQNFLQRHGRAIVDGKGDKVFLQGIGLGGWLVPEGYMLKVPGYGSPSRIRSRIADLIGEEATDRFFRKYRQNYVARQDIDKIAEWGFNSIRLPMHHGLLMAKDGTLLEEGFVQIDSLLSWCRANRLYLILDLHCASGGQNADNISDADSGLAALWTEPLHQQHTIALWRALAGRYAREEWIAGYDLLNEPVMPAGMSNQPLRDLYIRITRAIREVDPSHLIFIEGNWYATDFTWLTPPFDSQMVYSFHKYWNPTDIASLQAHLTVREQYDYPLWLGESGENNNAWFNRCIRLVESQDIGWCWWTHKKLATLTSPYSAAVPSSYRKVIDYWRGSAPRPDSASAVKAFDDLAEALRLENCEFHPDVVDALLRKDHHGRNQAYRLYNLPGILPCAEYDLGAEGIAYHDADDANEGGAFRNDGVDLRRMEDEGREELAVSHIEADEWMNYHIRSTMTGRCEIRARVYPLESGGALSLFIDGRPLIAEVRLPGKLTWKQWQWFSLGAAGLDAGPHVLRLAFAHGGFLIDQIEFVAAGDGSK